MKENTIQKAMFREMQEKSIFGKVHDHALQYLDEVLDREVFPSEEVIRDLHHFEEGLPTHPTDASQVLDLLRQYGSPATVAQLGGRYFGFVTGSTVPTGLAAKHLATYWDQNSAMQVMSPLAAKLESVVEKWLQQIFALSDNTVAGFVSGTSMANFCGLAAARYRLLKRLGWEVNEKGLQGAPKLKIITGKHAHATVIKALNMLGFGKEQVEWVDVDDQGRVIAERIPNLDEQTLLILQAGNVNSGSFDPLNEICEKAGKANAWVHIDGAFGLWTAAVDQLKHLTEGMEKANSWAVDGHKTLNTPYDSGIVLCNDKEAIVSALHASGSYLVLDETRDGMFFTPEMSRRARIVELWATMKYLGRNGISQMIYGFHERAMQFAEELRQVRGFEVLNDMVFNQVIVRCQSDELTVCTLERIQALRECWVGGSTWQGRKVIRISVCSWATTEGDISRSVRSFARALKEAKEELIIEN